MINELNSAGPINLINGSTMKFGNNFLQKFFQQLKIQNTDETIVITIIG